MTEKQETANSKTAAKTRALMAKVVEQIEKLALPAAPQFYELWYRYYDGDPEIIRAIEDHKGDLDEAECQKIYTRFLDSATSDTAVRKASDQVQGSIAKLATMLKSAKATTSDYSESLGGASEKISGATSLDDISATIASIIEETRKVMQKNDELESELAYSSKQLNELTVYLETVKKEATTDSLTGAANRKAFDKRISENVDDATAAKKPLVLMMLDIDHFKKFNDTFGHPAGDQVLRLVARTLTGNVKGQDMAARYGGEEFAILLPETPLSAGLKVAENLRQTLEKKEITNKATNQSLGSITLSIGVAEHRPEESVASLIERADAALYDAKHNGRNRVCAARG